MAQRLRPSNGSMLRVDSVMVMNKGCGYAKDMSLTPQANYENGEWEWAYSWFGLGRAPEFLTKSALQCELPCFMQRHFIWLLCSYIFPCRLCCENFIPGFYKLLHVLSMNTVSSESQRYSHYSMFGCLFLPCIAKWIEILRRRSSSSFFHVSLISNQCFKTNC